MADEDPGCWSRYSASRFIGQMCKLEVDGEWVPAMPMQESPNDVDLSDQLSEQQHALCSRLSAFLRGREWQASLLARSRKQGHTSVIDYASMVRFVRGCAGACRSQFVGFVSAGQSTIDVTSLQIHCAHEHGCIFTKTKKTERTEADIATRDITTQVLPRLKFRPKT